MAFDALPISAETKTALRDDFGLEFMTRVQSTAIPAILSGADALVRAKTGTGKTLAFLVPAVERVRRWDNRVGGKICVLVITPNRELAQQTAAEARRLLGFDGAACVYGGVSATRDRKALSENLCSILVATPTRLQAHIDSTDEFWDRLQDLKLLVLDEADQLLVGANRWKTKKRTAMMERVLEELPLADEGRQCVLLSATYPEQVAEIAGVALKQDYLTVDDVGLDEPETPAHIDQTYVLADIENMTELLWRTLEGARRSKAIVFFANVRLCRYYAEVFRQVDMDVLELDSKKSASYRTRVFNDFRTRDVGVLFTTDVSARGMDYPGVSMVVQVGAPFSRDMYVHRLGRTGRGGEVGKGVMLLYDFEQPILKEMADLPLRSVISSEVLGSGADPPAALGEAIPNGILAARAYIAWLGRYNSRLAWVGWSKEELVRQARRFAASMGAIGEDGLPPPVLKRLCRKMGLDQVRGLNTVGRYPEASNNTRGSAKLR